MMLTACAATALDAVSGSWRRCGLGEPLLDMSGSMPHVELQQLLDEDCPDGLHYYWKSLHLPGVTDQVVSLVEEWAWTE